MQVWGKSINLLQISATLVGQIWEGDNLAYSMFLANEMTENPRSMLQWSLSSFLGYSSLM
jgi:hypothetical protein